MNAQNQLAKLIVKQKEQERIAKESEKRIKSKIDFLLQSKQHLEAFFFIAASLERELSFIVKGVYETLEIIAMHHNIYCSLSILNKRIEEMTLGDLKNHFSSFCSDKKILLEIDWFIAMRNRCVHKLFRENVDLFGDNMRLNNIRCFKLWKELINIKFDNNRKRIELTGMVILELTKTKK